MGLLVMSKLLTSFFVFMHLAAVKCLGYVIAINLAWNMNSSPNIMEGSIVQLVVYNSSDASPPVANASGSFDESGDNSYDPFSTPENHDIVYETEFTTQGNTYRVHETYDLLGNYDRVYLRIFSSSGFDEEVQLSYWGLGTVSSIKFHGKTIVFMSYGQMDNENYFAQPSFEVIPEPSTSLLTILGGSLIFYRRLRDRRSGPAGQASRHG